MKIILLLLSSFFLISCSDNKEELILGIIPESPVVIDAPLKRCGYLAISEDTGEVRTTSEEDEEEEEDCIEIAAPWIRFRFYAHNKSKEKAMTLVVLRAIDALESSEYLIDFLGEQINYAEESDTNVISSDGNVNCSIESLGAITTNLNNGYIFEIPSGECRHFPYSIFLSLQADEEEGGGVGALQEVRTNYIHNLRFEALGWIGNFEEPTARLRSRVTIRTQ